MNNDKLVQQQNSAGAQNKKPVEILNWMLKADSVKEQFTNALGKHRDAFIASVIDLFTSDKALQTCKPQDVIAQALKAASMQLPINKALGFAYIVVYNNNVKQVDPATGRDVWVKMPTPTFIPGYKGYIQMAMRTGQYKTINADIVYEGELKGVDKLSGTIDFGGEKTSDKVIGYFCHFELLNGFKKTLFMTLQDMAAYAIRYSPSIGSGTTVEQLMELAQSNKPSKQVGWKGNFNEMAIKTVVRRLLSKYGYLSVEMQGAIAGDIENDAIEAERNDMITEGANATEINLDEAQYEEVVSQAVNEEVPQEKKQAEPEY